MESTLKTPWQNLEADLSTNELKGILAEANKGVQLGYAKDWKVRPSQASATIDGAMTAAKAYPDGLGTVAKVLVAMGRDAGDNHLLASLAYPSSLLPESAPAAVAWTSLVRSCGLIGAVIRGRPLAAP